MYYQYYKYWFTSSHTKPTIHQPHTPKYLNQPRCLRLSVDQEGFCGIIIARQSHLHFTFLPRKKTVLVNAWPTWPWNQNSAEFARIFSSLDGSMIRVRNLQSRRFSAKVMRCCFHLFSLRCIIESVQTNLRENWGTWLSISNQTVDAFVNRTFWDCSSSLSFACDMCLCPSIFYTSPTFSGIRYFGAHHIPIHCQYAEKSKISFMFQLDPETKSTPSISIFRTRSPARPQVRPTSSGSTFARVALSFPDSSCQHNSSITSKRDSAASWYNISYRTDRPGKNMTSSTCLIHCIRHRRGTTHGRVPQKR